MLLFFILLLFYLTLSPLSLLQEIAASTAPLQNSCSIYFTSHLSHGELASAFVCGTPLHDPHWIELFKQTSLIHLLVVSGGHLQIILQLGTWILPKQWKKPLLFRICLNLLLLFYALLSGFQPPIVRALGGQWVAAMADRFRWNWDPGKVQIFSGLCLLCLSPEWILNFSFYLSWLASVGFAAAPLCLTTKQRRRRPFRSKLLSFWLSCLCIQSLMSFAFHFFSPLGLLMNALLSPLISVILFPASLSILLHPSLRPWIDGLWDLLLQLLSFCTSLSGGFFSLDLSLSQQRWIVLWIFLAFAHVFFESLRRQRYRGSYV